MTAHTTEPKFNPNMGDYDMTILRCMNGDLPGTSLREGSALNTCVEDMMNWGYIDRHGCVTPKGKRYIEAHSHRYAIVDL